MQLQSAVLRSITGNERERRLRVVAGVACLHAAALVLLSLIGLSVQGNQPTPTTVDLRTSPQQPRSSQASVMREHDWRSALRGGRGQLHQHAADLLHGSDDAAVAQRALATLALLGPRAQRDDRDLARQLAERLVSTEAAHSWSANTAVVRGWALVSAATHWSALRPAAEAALAHVAEHLPAHLDHDAIGGLALVASRQATGHDLGRARRDRGLAHAATGGAASGCESLCARLLARRGAARRGAIAAMGPALVSPRRCRRPRHRHRAGSKRLGQLYQTTVQLLVWARLPSPA